MMKAVKVKSLFTVCSILSLLLLISMPVFSQELNRTAQYPELMKWNGLDVAKGQVMVKFKAQAAVSMDEVHKQLGTRVEEAVDDGLYLVRFDGDRMDEVLNGYNQHSAVEYAEPNHVYWPHAIVNDPYWSQQWGPKKIGCVAAWAKYQGDPNALVAVIDTGVDMDHADLMNQYAGGYDYVNNDNNPNDTSGHGTHTCGTAGGDTNNGIGVAGLGYNCRFLAYRAGTGYFLDSNIVKSVNAAKNAGALVISMSFSGPGVGGSVQSALLSAYNAGVIPVAAAGNDGNTNKDYPAALSFVMGVASSNQSDNRSGFSNYGSWVDVAAPGQDIVSCWNNGGYASADGTSMACPHVAGVATFLYALAGGNRSTANRNTVRNALFDSAVNVGTWVKYGRIDVNAAMDLVAPQNPPTISNVSPSTVQAFSGGTVTVQGSNFVGITTVNVGGTALTGGSFTVVDENTITFGSPKATALGNTAVTAENAAGTSNPGYFNYIETDPPKLTVPLITGSGSEFTWAYGAGALDNYHIIVSLQNTTFKYYGDSVLLFFNIVFSSSLNQAGTGELTVTIPSGLVGLNFWSQVVTFDDQTGAFAGATNIKSTAIIN